MVFPGWAYSVLLLGTNKQKQATSIYILKGNYMASLLYPA